MRMIPITCLTVVAGCAAAPLPTDGNPTSGIYQLTETRSGDCIQQQPDDTIDGYVIAGTSPALSLYMTAPTFAPADPANGWFGVGYVFFEVPSSPFARATLMCGGATDHMTITVEAATADHVRGRRVDSFSDVAGNLGACAPGMLPAADCSVTTELDYTLRQPCPRSCIQTGDPDPNDSNFVPTLSCSC